MDKGIVTIRVYATQKDREKNIKLIAMRTVKSVEEFDNFLKTYPRRVFSFEGLEKMPLRTQEIAREVLQRLAKEFPD